MGWIRFMLSEERDTKGKGDEERREEEKRKRKRQRRRREGESARSRRKGEDCEDVQVDLIRPALILTMADRDDFEQSGLGGEPRELARLQRDAPLLALEAVLDGEGRCSLYDVFEEVTDAGIEGWKDGSDGSDLGDGDDEGSPSGALGDGAVDETNAAVGVLNAANGDGVRGRGVQVEREDERPFLGRDVGDGEGLRSAVALLTDFDLHFERRLSLELENEVVTTARGERIVDAESVLRSMEEGSRGEREDVLLETEKTATAAGRRDESSGIGVGVERVANTRELVGVVSS